MVTVRRTMVRSALVLGVGAAVTFPGALAAGGQPLGADVEPSPSPSVTDYPPPEEPTHPGACPALAPTPGPTPAVAAEAAGPRHPPTRADSPSRAPTSRGSAR